MLNREKQLDLLFDLINAFSFVRKPKETATFLQDILTAKEVENLAKRLRIAKLLLAGESQRDIALEVKCSIATVTKVQSWLNQKGSGFKKVISQLPKRYSMPKKLPPGPIEYHLPQTIAALTQYSLVKFQEERLNKFQENINAKKLSDKFLKKIYDERYKRKKV